MSEEVQTGLVTEAAAIVEVDLPSSSTADASDEKKDKEKGKTEKIDIPVEDCALFVSNLSRYIRLHMSLLVSKALTGITLIASIET